MWAIASSISYRKIGGHLEFNNTGDAKTLLGVDENEYNCAEKSKTFEEVSFVATIICLEGRAHHYNYYLLT